MKKLISTFLSFTVAFSPLLGYQALAQTSTTPTELPVSAPPTASATQQLQNVQQKQSSNSTMYYLGAAAAGAFAVWKGTVCAASNATDMTACGLAAAGVVAAALLAMSGGKTQAAANDAGAKATQLSANGTTLPSGSDGSTTTGSGTTGSGTTGSGTDSSGILMNLPPALASKLATAGISVDPAAGTITTPNGQTYDAAALASGVTDPTSASGIPNSGLVGSIKDEMNSALADAAKKMNDGSAGDLMTATGAARPPGGNSATTDNGVPTRKIASAVNRDPAQVEGLKTLYNGEPIGVASDSIFGIVDRRYTEKMKTGAFNP